MSTRIISIAANKLFFSTNWRGVNAKLKIRLSRKGSTTISGICFCHTMRKTLLKEIAITI
jgi:hypothetical protein